jgi:hypothetical protein
MYGFNCMGKKELTSYLYVVISDDYVWAFEQSTLYSRFKKGGQPSQGLDKNELFLCKAT